MWRNSSPLRASSAIVEMTVDGGGTSRPLDQPAATIHSHTSAAVTGNSRPSAGRVQRRHRVADCGANGCVLSTGVSSVIVIAKPCPAADCKTEKRQGPADRPLPVPDEPTDQLVGSGI